LAVYVAYALAIQAMMASVGLGMSAGAAAERTDNVLCSFAFNQTANVPVRDGDRQKPGLHRNARFASLPRKARETLRPWAPRRRFQPMPVC
jgi:hypothetical protein